MTNVISPSGSTLAEAEAFLAAHLEIEAFDETTVQELRDRARNVLLTEAIVTEEKIGDLAEDLLGLDGMDKTLAGKLAVNGIKSLDDLADLAVDELTEISGIDAERAKQLITTARAHWFE